MTNPWSDIPTKSLRRRFVTPEGVDLRLELGSAGVRAAAFTLDAALQLLILIAVSVAIAFLLKGAKVQLLAIVWLLGFFALRNGWFVLWEMGARGATPGKRASGLRVVARDGARLTGAAVIARNAMREIEIFLPLTFLAMHTAKEGIDGIVILLALAWSSIFLFFPLFNRDRLRVGDLVAGTWVVRTGRARLGADLATSRLARPTHAFSDAALSLYGEYELQALEDVVRSGRPEAIRVVAEAIRTKAGIPDQGYDADFLQDYYAALCARLERGMLLGRRRANKFARASR